MHASKYEFEKRLTKSANSIELAKLDLTVNLRDWPDQMNNTFC